MTDLQKDLDCLRREIDQVRSTAAKARRGQPTEVISQGKAFNRVFALVLPVFLIGIAWVIAAVVQMNRMLSMGADTRGFRGHPSHAYRR